MAISSSSAFPTLPGVYLFKDGRGSILYIGKAKNLRKRIQSYFVKQATDWKIANLIKEHTSIAHIVTKNETEALLLEAQLIRDYKPRFNVLLKTGQPFVYLLFTESDKSLSQVVVVRNKKKKGVYFGPFLQKSDARAVHAYLVRTFKLYLCNKKLENGCLDFHIGKCAGSCKTNFDRAGYLTRLELAQDLLRDNHELFLKRLHAAIADHNQKLEFEKSAHLNSYITSFESIFTTIKTKFHERKYVIDVEDAVVNNPAADDYCEALKELQKLLQLPKVPATIDCFDISHFQSTHMVGSCIRFKNGVKDPDNFRRFKVKSIVQQDDYAALQEIVARRYRDGEHPDVVLIDGGKGQRNAVKHLIPEGIACISLAKREERLFTDVHPEGVVLDLNTSLGRLLIALRDYAHHFAVSYHRQRKRKSL